MDVTQREQELSEWVKMISMLQDKGFSPVVIVAIHESGAGLEVIGGPTVDDVRGLLHLVAETVSEEPVETVALDGELLSH